MEYPFYYFGAGVMICYDINRADIFIKFGKKPSVKQVQAIVDIAPSLIFEDWLIERLRKNGLDNGIMYICSEDDIEDLIEDTYDYNEERIAKRASDPYYKKKKKNKSPKPFEDYEKALEEWLMKVHEICPIEAVCRDNFHSDNTLSEWHTGSINEGNRLLEKWRNESKKPYADDDDDYKQIIDMVIGYMQSGGIKPQYKEYEIFEEPDDTPARDYEELHAAADVLAKQVKYKKRDRGETYFTLANHYLVPLVCKALIDGLTAVRQKIETGEEYLEIDIDIDLNRSSLMFYLDGEDDAFFEYKLGPILNKCVEIIEKMEEEGGYSYSHAVSNWFEDAVPGVPKKIYGDINVTINVSETGGDPVLQNLN